MRIILLLTPVPMGERRSSGMSALHSTYPDESHLLVDVDVTDVKEGCALGLVLEHLDADGVPVAAEILSTYVEPRVHRVVTTSKACRMRIKWVLTGARPSSTFGVTTDGVPIAALPAGEDPYAGAPVDIDLTTIRGLRAYLDAMEREAQAFSRRRRYSPQPHRRAVGRHGLHTRP